MLSKAEKQIRKRKRYRKNRKQILAQATVYYRKNRRRILARLKAYRRKNRKRVLAQCRASQRKHKERYRKAKRVYFRRHRRKSLSRQRSLYRKNREARQNTSRRYRHHVKQIVLTHYGKNGVLQCCWRNCEVQDIDMLTLDHVNNDGKVHRETNGIHGGPEMYQWIIRNKFPKGFQTLCMNHQLKKELQRKRRRAA